MDYECFAETVGAEEGKCEEKKSAEPGMEEEDESSEEEDSEGSESSSEEDDEKTPQERAREKALARIQVRFVIHSSNTFTVVGFCVCL